MKKIISALLAGAMISSGVPALAADVNITINGEEFIPKNALGEVVEPFIENGSTYLPVRALGEAVGKEVSFDAENYAVYIGVKPMEGDVKSYPYVQVEDKVYTEGYVNLGYRTENYILSYKMEKLAEEKINAGIITEEDIEKSKQTFYDTLGITEENMEMYASKNIGITKQEFEEYIYQLACQSCLINSVEIEDSVYEGYVTVKHILTPSKETADSAIEELNKGESFENLINKYNKDPGQTANSTYTFTYGEMVESFEKAAFALNENEYTKEPVMSEFGYHIILRLPLIKENANVSSYAADKIYDEIANIPDPEKIVFLSNYDDVYGTIDSIEITSAEFEFLGIALDINYADAFESIKQMFALVKVCESGYLSEEEIKAAYDVDISELEGVSEEFAKKVLAAYNMAAIIDSKLAGDQDAYEQLYALLDEASETLNAKVSRDIRVYVDGKILIPADVNNNYVKPLNIDGTVYVPVRAIVESLGMSASWDNDTRCVIINK